MDDLVPFRIRYLLSYNPKLCCAVRRIFVHCVRGIIERRAGEQGVANPHSASVGSVQRFGSALNLNLHFHALVLDGAYSCMPGELAPKFHDPPRDLKPLAQLRRVALRSWGVASINSARSSFMASFKRICIASAMPSKPDSLRSPMRGHDETHSMGSMRVTRAHFLANNLG